MTLYIVRRVLVSIPLLLVASFLSFALIMKMGDPLAEWKLSTPRTKGQIAAAEHRIGMDKPFLERYGDWAINFVQGDWGTTVIPGNGTKDVRRAIMHAAPISVRLVLAAEIMALLVGVAVGVLGAVRQYSFADYTVTGAAFVMFSMPLFCIAVMVKHVGIRFNNYLESLGMGRWIRTAGPPNGGFHGSFTDQLYQYSGAYILPTLCLVMIQFAAYSRFQRASMLEVISSDFVRTAQAKGLSQARVMWRHALRTALIPISTLSALSLSSTVSGAVVTETVFGWQGMGQLTVDAVNAREPFMILGVMMTTGIFLVLCNLAADLSYAILDPRIRIGR